MNSSELFKKTVFELKKSGIKSAEIDAQILLEFVSGKSREFLLTNPDLKLKNREIEALKNLTNRRKSEEPIAYITGHKEFFCLDFLVDKNVLIPRPETEMLAEQALEFIKLKVTGFSSRGLKILDIGTGSGNIIISIANTCNLQLATCNFYASDNSAKALAVAKKNAVIHNAKINFIQSDLFENISDKFDLIIANLPYVPIDGSDDKEIEHEPQSAIFAEDNGTEIIKKFLDESNKYINKDGLILAELDPRNANEILEHAAKLYNQVEIISDFSGQKRLLKILT